MLFKLRVYTDKFQTLDLGPHGLRREAVRELVGIVGSWHPLLRGNSKGLKGLDFVLLQTSSQYLKERLASKQCQLGQLSGIGGLEAYF